MAAARQRWADRIELQLDRPGLVDGLLSSSGMTVLYGESGAGKTFFAIDLACHIAVGEPWRGRWTRAGRGGLRRGRGAASVKRRIRAWLLRRGKLTKGAPEPPSA